MLEVMAQQVLLDGTASAASVAGNTSATGTAPSTTGALGATGGVIKKLAMTSTVDFNGREVI